jgi:hypothetical protein
VLVRDPQLCCSAGRTSRVNVGAAIAELMGHVLSPALPPQAAASAAMSAGHRIS